MYHARVNRRPELAATDLWLWRDAGWRQEPDREIIRLSFEPVEPNTIVDTPSFTGTYPDDVEDFLRSIMDAAWEMGIRPTGFKEQTDTLTATKKHLEDMRSLVFGTNEKEKQ